MPFDIQAEDKRIVIKQKLRRYFDGKIVRKGIWYIVRLEYDSNFDYDSGIVSADGAHLRSKKENQNDSPIKIIMKDYMASGSFARGKEELESWLCQHWLHYARLLLENRFLAALWYLEKSVSAVR